eukprot:s1650_g6.t1
MAMQPPAPPVDRSRSPFGHAGFPAPASSGARRRLGWLVSAHCVAAIQPKGSVPLPPAFNAPPPLRPPVPSEELGPAARELQHLIQKDSLRRPSKRSDCNGTVPLEERKELMYQEPPKTEEQLKLEANIRLQQAVERNEGYLKAHVGYHINGSDVGSYTIVSAESLGVGVFSVVWPCADKENKLDHFRKYATREVEVLKRAAELQEQDPEGAALVSLVPSPTGELEYLCMCFEKLESNLRKIGKQPLEKVLHFGKQIMRSLRQDRKLSEIVLALTAEELQAWASAEGLKGVTVLMLKQRLQGICGLSRFRQRILARSAVLHDVIHVQAPGELQLARLPFAEASKPEIAALLLACHEEDARMTSISWTKSSTGTMGDRGLTALVAATEVGNADIATLLLEANADKNLVDSFGATALSVACEGRFTQVANVLIEARADVNKAKLQGEAPLLTACRTGVQAIVEVLLRARASVNQVNDNGESPLYHAAKQGQWGCARILLEAGAQTDLCSCNGKHSGGTPLFVASSIGSLQIVDLLLRFRADTEKATDAGSTPLGQPQGSLETQGATAKSNTEVKLLLEAGAGKKMSRSASIVLDFAARVISELSLSMAADMNPHEVQNHLLKKFGDRKLIATYRYLMSSRQAPARNLGLKLRWELLRRHAFDEAWFQKHAEQQDED